jgi:subtilisin family serine protease
MQRTGIVSLAVLALAALIGPASFADQENGGRYIVVFSDAVNESAEDELIAQHGGIFVKELPHGERVVVLPNKASERALRLENGVAHVEEDVLVFTSAKPASTQPAQVLPWGIDRVDAELVWQGGNTAGSIRVGVIDTGIALSHPDLAANIAGGVNTINPHKNPNDDNGHGSHVAGIIAGLDNDIGVVGVAPEADLYAIKVLGANGSGYLSDVIEGIDWATANGMNVINMSLGTSVDSQLLHDAVIRAYDAGVVVVAAAGNSGGSVGYPGAYPEVIAVSATDASDQIASFSSRGTEVDLAAPGVSIFSTYKGSGYATLSGTSMSSPHVAGVAALVLHTPVGAYDADADLAWDPAELQQKLEDRAIDLGLLGPDDLYGAGLVDAPSSTQP